VTLRRATSVPVLIAVAAVCAASYIWLDRPLALACAELPESVVAPLELLTELGKSTWYLVACAGGYLVFRFLVPRRRPRSIAAFLFWAVAGSGILLNVIKAILGRARPVQLFDHGDFGWHFFETAYAKTSFPSGHTNTIVALTLGLAIVAPPSRPLQLALAVVAVVVALTRVFLTHHYPSDIVAGAYLAVVTTLWLRDFMVRRGHPLVPERQSR
jgi:undecaprenyl-diphosphatase